MLPSIYWYLNFIIINIIIFHWRLDLAIYGCLNMMSQITFSSWLVGSSMVLSLVYYILKGNFIYFLNFITYHHPFSPGIQCVQSPHLCTLWISLIGNFLVILQYVFLCVCAHTHKLKFCLKKSMVSIYIYIYIY